MNTNHAHKNAMLDKNFAQRITELESRLEEIEREYIFAQSRAEAHAEAAKAGDRNDWGFYFYHSAVLRMLELSEEAAAVESEIERIEKVYWRSVLKLMGGVL